MGSQSSKPQPLAAMSNAKPISEKEALGSFQYLDLDNDNEG